LRASFVLIFDFALSRKKIDRLTRRVKKKLLFFQCTTVNLGCVFANPSLVINMQPDTLILRSVWKSDARVSKPASEMDDLEMSRLVNFGKAANMWMWSSHNG
jgi:hypothetical protein